MIRNEVTVARPAISVVVPVYRAENYICQCIDSILMQTFTDFELLLVDDGSPDRSGEICDEYAIKDSRVRVFHKKNGGVSSARQYGIDNVRGEFTIHVDPDDWLEPNMFEELYKAAMEKEADMVICDFFMNYPSGKQLLNVQNPPSLDTSSLISDVIMKQRGSCWNKLVRSQCFKDHKIRIDLNVNIGEDMIFIIQVLLLDIHAVYLSKPLYHYRRNQSSDSYTNNLTVESFNQLVYGLDWMWNTLDNCIYRKALINRSVDVAFAGLRTKCMSRELYSQFLRQYCPIKYWLSFKNNAFTSKSIIVLISKILGYRFAKILFNVAYPLVYK